MPKALQDLRYAVRLLSRKPGFTAVAMLTLALGIGANTAIFSVINGVLLRPLPYTEPDQLTILWSDDPKHDLHEEGSSYPNFEDWKNQSHAFADMAVYTEYPVSLTGSDEPVRVQAVAVSANLLTLLGRSPVQGRDFSADDVERRERVIVLSNDLWRSRFGASPDVIGKTIEVDGRSSQIIGVMPPDFFFPTREIQLWEPITSFSRWDKVKARRYTDWFLVVGRLNPGATLVQAQAEMNTISRQLEQAYSKEADADFAGFGVNVVSLASQIFSPRLRLALWSLLGAVLFVLLIACANLANLMLTRGAAREREFAIRLALGASRARIVLQLLTENVVLAVGAGLLGLALAAVAIQTLVAFAPQDVPRLDEVRIDVRVLLFTFGLSLLASTLFGILPASKVLRTDPNDLLKKGGRGLSGGMGLRTRSLLVVTEVALAVVLLTGAGLLTRSFLRVQAVDPGFAPEHLLTMKVNLADSASKAQTWHFYQQVFERVAALPGVESVGATRHVFLETHPDVPVYIEGRPPGRVQEQLTQEEVSASYFTTMRIPLLRGTFFSDQDGPDVPRVALINEMMARRFFPGEDPVGKRFKYGGINSGSPFMTIVGVVGDTRRQGLDKHPIPEYFVPLSQEPAADMALVVRTAGEPLKLAGLVRREIQGVDKHAMPFAVTTVEHQLGEFSSQRSFQTWLLGLFSIVALALAAIGVYGVMSYGVTQRTHEIGIRIALGAQRSDILRLIVRQGMISVLVGLGAGVLMSLWLTPVLAGLLYGVSGTDPLTFSGVALLLTGVALLACYLPARRATGIDPMVALRYE